MAADEKARQEEDTGLPRARNSADTRPQGQAQRRFDWKSMLKAEKTMMPRQSVSEAAEKDSTAAKKSRWHMGMLGTDTEEVPGSVLLLSKVSEFNEPLGMQNAPARTSASSFPQSPRRSRESSSRRRWQSKQQPEKKKTPDGKFVLEPQPDDSLNDPLNWATWRRDAALLSLGFYCMLGGGMTPILAAGFHDVADEYHISEPRVALTTGLYMMGLGLGSVVLSPTAILYGKRPVYLAAAVCFVLSSVWCALSPNFASLVCARIFQGFAVSSVECLPSATVAEIYFLHEKAYRLGIYTLLLLGGKNLVPLVSAAIIQCLGWRWVFWVVAMIVGFAWCLLLVFVPETVWDRTPVPHKQKHRLGSTWSMSHVFRSQPPSPTHERKPRFEEPLRDTGTTELKIEKRHAHFAGDASSDEKYQDVVSHARGETVDHEIAQVPRVSVTREDYFNNHPAETTELEAQTLSRVSTDLVEDPRNDYTKHNSTQPPKTWIQQMRPYSGRLSQSSWLRVMIRPFILFAYPSILWSALVYSLSIGWLIVLSESVSHIYISRDTYNFTSLQAGLVYISPFVGGILGTAVAGKVSDLIVRWLARRNGGIYEPEFRLVMAIPIAITTVIGLMGYGWSVQERDAWIVPTIFFGFISFGCSLGSTTSITFAVDSYRQYAGEALVTLNFSKNIFHGLVFSLFFNKWLESEGSRDVFVAIGGIQLACMLTTIPMYIYGKRARLWTVRKNFMEKF